MGTDWDHESLKWTQEPLSAAAVASAFEELDTCFHTSRLHGRTYSTWDLSRDACTVGREHGQILWAQELAQARVDVEAGRTRQDGVHVVSG